AKERSRVSPNPQKKSGVARQYKDCTLRERSCLERSTANARVRSRTRAPETQPPSVWDRSLRDNVRGQITRRNTRSRAAAAKSCVAVLGYNREKTAPRVPPRRQAGLLP